MKKILKFYKKTKNLNFTFWIFAYRIYIKMINKFLKIAVKYTNIF